MRIRTLILAAVATFFFAFGVGFAGHQLQVPSPAIAAEEVVPCGSDDNCNSVPDGCGVGKNCAKTTCNNVNCPNGNQTATPCHYCN